MTSAQDAARRLPFVSFIMPTYNAERYLERALASIFLQSYPADRYEVIAADGGSADRTRAILARYPVTIIENPRRDAESGKFLALGRARGEVCVLFDSDNVIGTDDWLARSVAPLMEDEELVGVESLMLIAPDFSSMNAYANLLVIADPLARMLASTPSIERRPGYLVKRFAKGATPVSGANGFLWRRSVIDRYLDPSRMAFAETNFLSELAHARDISYAVVPETGIYHYYCTDLSDFIGKREKIAGKFLGRKNRGEKTWVDRRGRARFFVSVVYLASFIGPAAEGAWNALVTGRAAWLWHPIASFITIRIYVAQYVRRRYARFSHGLPS